jgi:hypothetical protein
MPMDVNLSSLDESVPGANDGSASVIVSGGAVPYNYSWDDPAGQTSATADGLAAGTYMVEITDANGCRITETVSVGLLDAIDDLDEILSIDIFPNPTSGKVILEHAQLTAEALEITVVNGLGQVVLKKSGDIFSKKTELNINKNAPGLYYIHLKSNLGILTRKVVLMK